MKSRGDWSPKTEEISLQFALLYNPISTSGFLRTGLHVSGTLCRPVLCTTTTVLIATTNSLELHDVPLPIITTFILIKYRLHSPCLLSCLLHSTYSVAEALARTVANMDVTQDAVVVTSSDNLTRKLSSIDDRGPTDRVSN